MQLLRRNRKIIVILFYMAFLFTSCSTPNSGIVEQVATDELTVQPMSVYTAETSATFPAWVLADMPDEGFAFYYEEQNLNIQFYVKNAEEPAVVWINGEKYPFSYGLGYSPVESEAPSVCISDINNDAEPDVFIYGTAYRTELRQDVYISDGIGGYTELGDITWNKNEMEHSFLFSADYLDRYRVKILAPDWNIEEVGILEEELREQLVSLRVYEGSAITEYGIDWEMNQLQGKSIQYRVGEDGNAYLYYEALIEAGYSEYDTGYGFCFEYLIHDSGYELKNVEFLDCVTRN